MQEEEKLIQKAQKGEQNAFGELYDKYFPKIYRFIFLKVSKRPDAEDLSHQVFLSAWRNIHTYESRGFPFSSWLYRIAHNSVIDFYRTRRDHLDIELVSAERMSTDPEMERIFDEGEEVSLVKKMLGRLREDEQTVLIMRFVEELSNKEIAQALDKSEGAVRVMQHRALKQLRKNVEEEYETNY